MTQRYRVAITETYATITWIEADSEAEALEIAEEQCVEGMVDFNTCDREIQVVE
jgi:hypothetical protein